MTVYVDALADYPSGRWCHLLSQWMDELHEFADLLGLRREWFQPGSTPHYDLTPGKRAEAISLGAVEADRSTVVRIIRGHRAARRRFRPSAGRDPPRTRTSDRTLRVDSDALTPSHRGSK